MKLNEIIAQLRKELESVQKLIAAFEQIERGQKPRRGRKTNEV